MTNIAEQHIFLVDDEPKVREIVSETLEELGLKVSSFDRAEDCLRQLHSQKCDLLITDLRMSEMNGIELLTEAKNLVPWVPVLIITGYGDIPTSVTAIKTGAADFIEKPLDKKTFLHKVISILKQSTSTDTNASKPLTQSEMRVLKLVIDGKSNKEIADLLNRSIRTIEAHRAHGMHKLGVDNLLDLVKKCTGMGLVDTKTKQEPEETPRNSGDLP